MIDIKSALEKSNKTSQGLASLLWPGIKSAGAIPEPLPVNDRVKTKA